MRTLSAKRKGFQKFLANFRDYGAQNLVDMRLRCARILWIQVLASGKFVLQFEATCAPYFFEKYTFDKYASNVSKINVCFKNWWPSFTFFSVFRYIFYFSPFFVQFFVEFFHFAHPFHRCARTPPPLRRGRGVAELCWESSPAHRRVKPQKSNLCLLSTKPHKWFGRKIKLKYNKKTHRF